MYGYLRGVIGFNPTAILVDWRFRENNIEIPGWAP